MRKLIFGLTAVLSLVFAMSSNAQAQESTEGDPIEQNTVECTMLNFTNPELRTDGGNFAVNSPISLEMYVPKGGPMYYYFVASLDGGEPVRLNDGMDNSVEWTPSEPGTYTVHGEFENSKDGSAVAVENPESCMVTLTVEAAQVEPVEPVTPVPAQPAPTCGEPETLTLVPNPGGWTDVYNADGIVCAQVAGEQPAQPVVPVSAVSAPEELPHTGTATTVTAMVGACLVLFGALLKYTSRRLSHA